MIWFIIFTIIALIATAGLSKILHISIQDGQWLDKLLGWQKRLYKWDIEGKELLAKAGGLCELCFSHAIAFCSFWVLCFFLSHITGFWITDVVDTLLARIAINIIWYVAYVSISTNMNLYTITKLYK